MKLNRILIFALVLLMIVPLMAACKKDDGEEPGSNNVPTVVGDENPNLAPIDGGGREFRYLVREPGVEFTYKYSEVLDDESGDKVNEKVVERNQFIEEKYKVIVTATTTKNATTSLRSDQTAGDTTYDLAMPMLEQGFMSAVNGLLTEWDKIPFVDIEKSYWRKDVYESTTIGGYQFFAISDSNFSAYNTVPVVYFNKDIYAAREFENLYEMVKAGRWTQEQMQTMAAVVTVDGNSDGMLEEGTQTDDIYGLVSGPFVWQPFFYASGMTMVAKDEYDLPTLSALTDSSERTIDIIEDIVNLMNDNTKAGLTVKIGYSGKGFDKFRENACLFYVECIYGQFQITDMANYGIVPIPVWEEGAPYTSYIHASHSSVSCIPRQVKDLNLSASIMEDMAFVSKQMIVPVFYDELIQHRNVRDEESYEMLSIIFGNIIVDLAQVMKQASLKIDDQVRGFVENNTPDVIASTFQDNKEAYKTIIDQITIYYTSEGAKQYQ